MRVEPWRKLWRGRTPFALAGTVALLTGLGLSNPTTVLAQQPWRLPASLHSDRSGALPRECVRNFSLTHVDYVLPSGARRAATPAEGAASRASLARAYYYRAGGVEVSQLVPPTGWKPVTATNRELKAYGFPPRPSGGAALRHWTDTMSRWKRPGRPGMCQTNVVAAPARGSLSDGVTGTGNSPFWAGGMTVNGSATVNTFTKSDGMWKQPTFTNPCGATAYYSMWSGLGGWNKFRLLQTGTDQNGFMWWEAIAPNTSVPEEAWPNSHVNPGDTAESVVMYEHSFVDMFVFDITTGESQSLSWSSLNGNGVADFYDGTTADFVTEDPSVGGSPAPLAKPAPGFTFYSYATADDHPISYWASWRINNSSKQTSNWDGVHAWNDYWHQC